ncbi:MAG: hypothetical protein AAGI01_17185 [Myxococcota bacterium]
MFDLSPPSALTFYAFVLLTALVFASWLAAIHVAASATYVGTRASRARATGFTLCFVWLIGHALVASSGILAEDTMPPRVVFYFAGINLVVLAITLTRPGRALAMHTPLHWLVGVNAFRLPLELLLHQMYAEGTLPVQMTYEGANLDIITGILAIPAGLAIWHLGQEHRASRRIAWVFTGVGAALLVNVITIALLSAPGPLRTYPNEPAVTLVFHTPYTWIVTVMVTTAMVTHILTARHLLLTRQRGAAG